MKTKLAILVAVAGCSAIALALAFLLSAEGPVIPWTLAAALGCVVLSTGCLAAVLLLTARDQARTRRDLLSLLRRSLKVGEWHSDSLRRMSHNLDIVREVVVNHLAHDHLVQQLRAPVQDVGDLVRDQALTIERFREEVLSALLRLRLNEMERLKDTAVLESLAQMQRDLTSDFSPIMPSLAGIAQTQQAGLERVEGASREGVAFLEGRLEQGLGSLRLVVSQAVSKAVDQVLQGQHVSFESCYRQIEALIQLQRVLPGDVPLPKFRDWAVSPDFALALVECILDHQPGLVVELGSGLSSLIVGLMLRRAQRGRLISLESDAVHAERTRRQVELAGLGDRVEVRLAPLREHRLQGESWSWYDFDPETLGESVDLLVVDGPPRTVHPQVRYPALPIMASRLAPEARIFLDDANREGEKQILERWRAEFPEYIIELLPHEKGTAVLRKPS